ncbi:DUF6338 family protein [Amycolatopsis nivea]
MGQAPSTVVQVVLVVLVVVPGVTYQLLRERWRGPVPGERDLGQRVLRAVTASIVLDAAYAIVLGPQLLRLAHGSDMRGWDGLAQQPRLAAVVALALFVVVPALAAAGVSWWQRRRRPARFSSVPTAWDHAFRDRRPCFVRARLKNGGWIGGWYGPGSYASSYPQEGEVYLQTAWRLDSGGRLTERVEHTAGLYLRVDSVDFLEFLDPPTPTAQDGT